MRPQPGPVTADDVDHVMGATVDALAERLDRDWHVPAGPLEWDCWETVEHIANGLFSYATRMVPVRPGLPGGNPIDWQPRRPDGPDLTIWAAPDAGPAGLLRVLDACGGLVGSLVRTAPPTFRADHMWGRTDPEGFAAMTVVEMVAHLHDMAGALDVAWAPDQDLCDRAVHRLFPDAPDHADRAATLLWATGRAELPGHPRLGEDDWRWFAEPR